MLTKPALRSASGYSDDVFEYGPDCETDNDTNTDGACSQTDTSEEETTFAASSSTSNSDNATPPDNKTSNWMTSATPRSAVENSPAEDSASPSRVTAPMAGFFPPVHSMPSPRPILVVSRERSSASKLRCANQEFVTASCLTVIGWTASGGWMSGLSSVLGLLASVVIKFHFEYEWMGYATAAGAALGTFVGLGHVARNAFFLEKATPPDYFVPLMVAGHCTLIGVGMANSISDHD